MDTLGFDIFELVGKHVVIKRQEIREGFWTHNGSNMRLVHNQINNIAFVLEKNGQSITPKQVHPKTHCKYVSNCAPTYLLFRIYLKPGMHVATPQWGSWVRGSTLRLEMPWRYVDAQDYIKDKTKECVRNPRLTWAQPPLYGLYKEWAEKYTD
jgi:hypothetical protein